MNIKNKKILLIAPRFFGYENDIIESLENNGAKVVFIQENIDATEFKFKILNKMPATIRRLIINNYFISKFKKLCKNEITFDYVFCIRINSFDHCILSILRKLFPNARYICYFWDSVLNMRNAVALSSYFDKIITFDKEDAIKYKWNFIPLFYNNKYGGGVNAKVKDIDILFVASLLPERAKLYTKLNELCTTYKLTMHTYFTVNPYLYYVNKRLYKEIPSSIVHFTGLQQSELIELVSKSKIIMDCSSQSQSGLTMRSIECIGAKKRMITTNQSILSYDFYDNNNILLLTDDDKDDKIIKFICEDQFKELDISIYNKYSISSWIANVFSKNSTN